MTRRVRCALCVCGVSDGGDDAWTTWDRNAWARRRLAALPALEPVWDGEGRVV